MGGPARHVVWLTDALQGNDFESVLIAGRVPEGEEDMGYFADEYGVKPVFIEDMSRELSISDITALWRIWRRMVAEKPDIVHTHTAKAGTLGRAASFLYRWVTPRTLVFRPRKLRVFHTFHGHIFNGYYSDAKTGIFLFIERVLARFATDTIVTISDQQLNEISKTYNVAPIERMTVIPLGMDFSRFGEDKEAGRNFRQEIGVADDEILVGIVGRLTEIKNHKLFVEAVRNLRESGRDKKLRFVVIGDGALRSELEAEAGSLGIIFAGNRTDTAGCYSALDFAVLCSLNEGTPLTLIEAMACGKAWVASEVGGVVDLAGKSEDGDREQDRSFAIQERGLLFDSGDAKGFADAIDHLASDSVLREKLAKAGRDFVLKSYGKDRLVEDIRRLYSEQR